MNKKSVQILRIVLYLILCAVLFTAEGFTLIKLLQLGLLPTKFVIPILAFLLIITAFIVVFLFPGWKNCSKVLLAILRIISVVLCIAAISGCFIGSHVLIKLEQTFSQITSVPTVNAHIGVYLLRGDPAKEIQDTSAHYFGTTDAYDAENNQIALAGIEKLLDKALTIKKYDNVFFMVDALYQNDVQAIILNTAYIGILESVDRYADFSERTKLLYTYDVEEEIKPPDVPPVSDVQPDDPTAETVPPTPTNPPDPTKTPFVLYISGVDTRSDFLERSNSDVNILAAVNPKNKQILLVSTPRDYFIPNPAGNGALDKLTHCGAYGVACSVQALSDLYHQPVSYHAQINFAGFETLIDAIGGITIYSDESDGIYLNAGENYMDAEQALKFARDRYSYSDGDHARGRHQMMVISAVVDKMTSASMLKNYSALLDSLQGMFTTSLPSNLLTSLIQMQLSDMAKWDVLSYAVTGVGDSQITYSMPGYYAYVMHPDQKTVQHASSLIGRVLRSEKLTPQDVQHR